MSNHHPRKGSRWTTKSVRFGVLASVVLQFIMLPQIVLAEETAHADQSAQVVRELAFPRPGGNFGGGGGGQPHPAPQPAPRPQPMPQPRPMPQPAPRPQPAPQPRPEPMPQPRPMPQPTPQPRPMPQPTPQPRPMPQPGPGPLPHPVPQPQPHPEPGPQPQPRPQPGPQPGPMPHPVPQPQPQPRPEPGPMPQPQPHPQPGPNPGGWQGGGMGPGHPHPGAPGPVPPPAWHPAPGQGSPLMPPRPPAPPPHFSGNPGWSGHPVPAPVFHQNPVYPRPMPLPNDGYHNGAFFPGAPGDDRWNNMNNERADRDSHWGCYPYFPFTYDPYPFFPYPWYPDWGTALYPGYTAPTYTMYPTYPIDVNPLPVETVHTNWVTPSVDINQSVSDTTLDLNALLGLDQYQGYDLVSVEVYTDYGSWNPATFNLFYDDVLMKTELSQGSMVVLRPNQDDRVGVEFDKALLTIQGSANISRIVVNLRQTRLVPGDFVEIDQPMLVTSVGVADIDVYAQLNLARYPGYRVVSVVADGIADEGTAYSQMFINTYNMGVSYHPAFKTTQEMWIDPGHSVIGQGMDSWHMYVNGRATISRIHVKLIRY